MQCICLLLSLQGKQHQLRPLLLELEPVQFLVLDQTEPIHGQTGPVSDLFWTDASPCVAFFTQYVGTLIFT